MRPKLFWGIIWLVAAGGTGIAQERLRLATTTSIQDSGLMPYLLSRFEKSHRFRVHVIAVGSGQALKLASSGDVDMVIVHDPESEQKFMAEGFGAYRKTFMMNDFVLVGPPSDPAGIRNMKDASMALAKIWASRAPFISRGDASGTHQRERLLWKKAGLEPMGNWYLDIGQGMGAVLTVANEKNGYALCDRATYLTRMNKLKLRILVENGPDLANYYSAIPVAPQRFPRANWNLATRLIDWLCSEEGQKLIDGFKVNGHRLFKANCTPGE